MTRRMISLFLLMMMIAAAGLAQDAAAWDRDLHQHWHTDANGGMTDAAPHTLQDDIFCTVCESEVWVYDDGSGDVYNYNPFGDLMRNTSYDASGAVADDYYYICAYTEDGVKQMEQIYYFSTLIEETSYRIGLLGDVVPMLQTGWYDDGTSAQNEYDEYGSVIRATTYDEAGNLAFEEISEYTYGEDGVILGITVNGQYTDGESYKNITNQYGDTVYNGFFNADGSVIFESREEIEYDEFGSKISAKNYMDDVLISESVYVVEYDEFGSWSREKTYTEYNEDGTRFVLEYGENGDELSSTYYDADGNIIDAPADEEDAGDEGVMDDTILEGGAIVIDD